MKSCTGAKLLKEPKMKKTILTTLLILAIATASIFAVDDSFTVTTTVAERGDMKVSANAIAGHTPGAYTTAGDFTTLPITASGTQTFSAYMTTLSNKRTGYTVTMAATPMASVVAGQTTSYIDYTVGCGSQSIVTHGAAAPTVTGSTVDTVTALTGLTGKSIPITLSVDATTFAAAVSGSYIGTVTFTFSAT